MVTVRPATVAPAMRQLVVRAWQAAYRRQMPDDYLNGLRRPLPKLGDKSPMRYWSQAF